MRFSILLSALALVPISTAIANTSPTGQIAAVDELLSVDEAFSRSGAAANLVDSVAAIMSDQVIMPLPNGTFARGKDQVLAALRANPANAAAKASWSPVRGGISSDGRHGFTYGFMTIREAGKPDRRAKYLAYWIKSAIGWRVAAYKRAPSGPGDVQTARRAPIISGAKDAGKSGDEASAAQRDGLVAAEKSFSDRAQQVGLAKAFAEFGSPDAMNMGRGPGFTFGNQAIGAQMPPAPKSPVLWAADEGVLVAPSGDLGVTFGYIRPNGPPPAGQPSAIPFFTVWYRASANAPWRYIAE